jgi:hypothetical protein
MKSISSKKQANRYASEDKQYWENHLTLFSTSGLNRRRYCQQQGVDYDRFAYWIKRLKTAASNTAKHTRSTTQSPTVLLPVQLKTQSSARSISATVSRSVVVLATMHLKNGHALEIHDERGLLVILERCA